MEEYTKAEQKANKNKIAYLVKQDGWPLLKEMVGNFVLETEREIMIAPAEDKDKMVALANKLKFGTGAMLWLLQEAERIAEDLTNNKDL